jgi:hypothetical protein
MSYSACQIGQIVSYWFQLCIDCDPFPEHAFCKPHLSDPRASLSITKRRILFIADIRDAMSYSACQTGPSVSYLIQ